MIRTVGVLVGGDSPEREVSLLSGRGVADALIRRDYTARMVEIATLDDLVPALAGIDVAFNCLHGGSGEDGTVRLMLDAMEIPTIGSSALASARAMDKARAKAILQTSRIPTPVGVDADAESLPSAVGDALDSIGLPMILKPRNGGSTIAVYRVEEASRIVPLARSILETFDGVLLEAFIAGRELTVGILENEGEPFALPVIEIRCTGDLFDFDAKYSDGEAEFLAPAPLSADVAARVQDVALRAHQALGCSGFSRVDVRLGDDGVPYVLEVNTLPGMTPLSDLPRAAALVGISYDDLVERMLDTASCPHHG